jgi:hypothetical protein
VILLGIVTDKKAYFTGEEQKNTPVNGPELEQVYTVRTTYTPIKFEVGDF